MATFTDDFLRDVRTRLGSLSTRARDGAIICAFCGSADLQIDRRPVVLHVGGLEGGSKDSTTNVRFAVATHCNVCGRIELFDSELHASSDTPVLVPGD